MFRFAAASVLAVAMMSAAQADTQTTPSTPAATQGSTTPPAAYSPMTGPVWHGQVYPASGYQPMNAQYGIMPAGHTGQPYGMGGMYHPQSGCCGGDMGVSHYPASYSNNCCPTTTCCDSGKRKRGFRGRR